MPRFLAKIHDDIIKECINNSTDLIFSDKVIFPLNKDRYMVPCTLKSKILPTLDEGIQFVGYMQEIQQYHCTPYNLLQGHEDQKYTEHYIIYDPISYQVISCTYSVYQFFGIPAELTNQNSTNATNFSLDMIIPKIKDAETKKILGQKNKSIILEINTSNIQFEYLFEDSQIKNEIVKKQLGVEISQNNSDQQLDKSSHDIKLNNNINLQQSSNGSESTKSIYEKNNACYKSSVQQLPVDTNNEQQNDGQNKDIQYNQLNKNEDYQKIQQKKKIIEQKYQVQLQEYLDNKYKSSSIEIELVENVKGCRAIKFIDLNEPQRDFTLINDENEKNIQLNQEQESQEINQEEYKIETESLKLLNKIKEIDQNVQIDINKIKSNKQNIPYHQNNYVKRNTKQFVSVSHKFMKNNKKKNENKKINQHNDKESNNSNTNESNTSQQIKNKQIEQQQKELENDYLNNEALQKRELIKLETNLKEKKENNLIIILFKVSILLYLLVIIQCIIQNQQQIKEVKDLKHCVRVIYELYHRSGIFPQVAKYSRDIQLVANDYYVVGDQVPENLTEQQLADLKYEILKEDHILLSQLSEDFQEFTFLIIEEEKFIKQIQDKQLAIEKKEVSFLQEDSSIIYQQNDFSNSIQLYITAVNSISQCRWQEFVEVEGSSTECLQYLYHIIENGLYVLREQNDYESKEFHHLYEMYIDSYKVPSYALTFASIFVVFCFAFTLPLIWKYSHLKTEVFLVFSYIPYKDRKEFQHNCIKFQQWFLNQKSQMEVQIEKQEVQEQKKQGKQEFLMELKQKTKKNKEDKQMQQLQIQQQNSSFNDTSVQKFDVESLEQSSMDIEGEEKQEILLQHQRNIQNQQKINKLSYILKFLFIFLFFTGVFLWNQYEQNNITYNVRQSLDHVFYLSQRTQNVLYLLIFTEEEIIGTNHHLNEKDMIEYFTSYVYEEEDLLAVQLKEWKDIPNQLKVSKDLYYKNNQKGLCEWVEKNNIKNWDANDTEKCQELALGILNDGVLQSIFYIVEQIRIFVREYREVLSQQNQEHFNKEQIGDLLNRKEFKEMFKLQGLIRKIIENQIKVFRESYLNFMKYELLVIQESFYILVVSLSILFFFIWIPYIYILRKQMIKIEEMVNIIPVQIIYQNQDMKVQLAKRNLISKHFINEI